MVDVFIKIEETLNDFCRSCIHKETSDCIKLQCPILHTLMEYGKILAPEKPKNKPAPRTEPYINRPWTEEEKEILLEHVHTDMRRTDLAKLIGRPYSSVVNRIYRMRENGEL